MTFGVLSQVQVGQADVSTNKLIYTAPTGGAVATIVVTNTNGFPVTYSLTIGSNATPAPQDYNVGTPIPTNWVANTAYAYGNAVSNNGYIWKCAVAGTSNTTTAPQWPTDSLTPAVTKVLDGNYIVWRYQEALPAVWKASTTTRLFNHIQANGSIWSCTEPGLTGAVAPTWPASPTAGTTVDDGSVVWTYQEALPANWAASTVYATNATVIANNGIWIATKGGTSGTNTTIWPANPTTAVTVSDGNAVIWVYAGYVSSTNTGILGPVNNAEKRNYIVEKTVLSAGEMIMINSDFTGVNVRVEGVDGTDLTTARYSY